MGCSNLRKRIYIMCIISALIISVFIWPELRVYAEPESYDRIEFSGDSKDKEEFCHFLFAKLAYDYLDDSEGKTVREYVKSHPELYAGEIWEDSGITYEALYGSIVGDWRIYKVFNHNTDSGLYAVAFLLDNKVVLTYRGSEMFTEEFPLDESNDWTGTDFKFAVFNRLSRQFEDADNCLTRLKALLRADGVPADITLAGHSLGGALVTYESLVTGLYGYCFDGACGHVIDLVYYYMYMEIDDFEGIDCVRFCNYTDTSGYPVADLIQHTNSWSMFQVDRQTELENLNENTLIPKLSSGGSHIIWSTLSYEGNMVFFTERVDADENGFTYAPKEPVCLDITKNILEAGAESFDCHAPWSMLDSVEDYEYMLGTLAGVIKDGRVVLGSSEDDTLTAYNKIGVTSLFDVNVVMYGGAGDDVLYGYTADDVLIAGTGDDFLYGNLGNDTYIIDPNPNHTAEIHDIGGEKASVILRNLNVRSLAQLTVEEDGTIVLAENQRIRLSVAQNPDNIEIYSYDNGSLRVLGTFAELESRFQNGWSGCYEASFTDEYKYVVMLEGEGRFDLRDISGMQLESITNLDMDGVKCIDMEYGRAYLNGDEGSESILLIMNQEYDIRLTSENGRVNLALGKYSDAEGMVGSNRKYGRNFNDYAISFSDASLNDGAQGQVGWQDALYSGISIIEGWFR